MDRGKLFAGLLATIVSASMIIYLTNASGTASYKPGISREVDSAVNQAQHLYRVEKGRGMDFSAGPCLSNAIQPEWAADIIHNPRTPADDLPQNQCASFLEGRVKHLVELDLNGSIVRVK